MGSSSAATRSRPVGIDLGTTYSAIARVNEDGQAVIIPNAEGEPITPSVVYVGGGEVIVGQRAKEMQAAGEQQVVAFFKREMGSSQWVFTADGRDYSPTDLSAFVLAKLKRDAALALNLDAGEPLDAIITVPAYFRDPQRRATIRAGQQAGLNVLQVINEPTAAAIAYGAKPESGERLLLVYDLGGGTFDVTLLRATPDEIVMLQSEGDDRLGGKDWDDRIVEFGTVAFREEFGYDAFAENMSLADLLVQVEQVKQRLSAVQSAIVTVRAHQDCGRYELTRAHFEELSHDLIERTASLCHKVLADQGLTPGQVDGVVLVGGATRMPMVHAFIQQTFGKPPLSGVHVDQAVALGAARMAAMRKELRLTGQVKVQDINNHSLGMIAVNADETAYVNTIILPKNLPIPCAEQRPYKCRAGRASDRTIEVFVTQGELSQPNEVTYLRKYVIHDIPASKEPSIVDISYSYDVSGAVGVSAQLRADNRHLPVTEEPLPDDVPDRFMRPPRSPQGAGPMTILLAFDLSGSMCGAPTTEAQKAARSFIRNLDLSHVSVGVIGVADRVETVLDACQNARDLERAIERLPSVSVGAGNSADPFNECRELLKKRPGVRVIIVLADGIWYEQAAAIERAKLCHKAGIDVIAIGFGSADKAFLRAIASTDEASIFTQMTNLTETFMNIAQVLTESSPDRPSDTGKGWLNFGRPRR